MKLTRRGKFVVMFLLMIVLWLLCMFVSHVVVDCDLRAGSTGPCQVLWIDGGL